MTEEVATALIDAAMDIRNVRGVDAVWYSRNDDDENFHRLLVIVENRWYFRVADTVWAVADRHLPDRYGTTSPYRCYVDTRTADAFDTTNAFRLA